MSWDSVVLDVRAYCIAWKFLAAKGECDEWGGAECKRVLKEWLTEGRPVDVTAFIRDRANAGASGRRA